MLEEHLPRDKDDDLYAGAVEYAVSKQGALPIKNPPPFTAARQELAGHLKKLMSEGVNVKLETLRGRVKHIAAKHGKKAKP
jgi:hypothetical protein